MKHAVWWIIVFKGIPEIVFLGGRCLWKERRVLLARSRSDHGLKPRQRPLPRNQPILRIIDSRWIFLSERRTAAVICRGCFTALWRIYPRRAPFRLQISSGERQLRQRPAIAGLAARSLEPANVDWTVI